MFYFLANAISELERRSVMKFSAQTRKETIEKLASEKLELLIIGGGITGAGLALQAGTKEMHAGLIEMQDFAAGTSSRSTKLVHGGLRYLKQFEVELVAEITKERKVISHNAPHIVQPERMLLPIYDELGASFNAFSAEVALDLYDRLAEVDSEWEHRLISREEILEENPSLKEEDLVNGGLYLDYINDDARLTIEILKKAHELGTLLANYVKALDFIYDENDHIAGVEAEDTLTGEKFEIYADVVVNATGPWSDEIQNKQRGIESDRMYPSEGVHLVVDAEKLPVTRTIYTDTGLNDHRMIFIIPRGDKTYFGTTDTPYKGDLKDPPITKESVDYLLKAVNFRFPDANIELEDIETGWAGLRPLILEEGATDSTMISRDHAVSVSEAGLVTIAGGKLTDYRLMAEDTFLTIEDELKMKTGATYPEGDTKNVPLSGGKLPKGTSFSEYVDQNIEKGLEIGLSEREAYDLIEWYGTNAELVFSLNKQVQAKNLPLRLELELLYALEYESILSPVDFFLRRTDILLFATDELEKWEIPVIDYMAEYLNWTEAERAAWIKELRTQIEETQLEHIR